MAHYAQNMTSSTKPEAHNVLQCRQKRTEPRTNVMSTKNFVKFGRHLRDMQVHRLTGRHAHKQAFI